MTPEPYQIESRVDMTELPHPLDPALAVRRGEGAQAAQIVLVRGPGRADHRDAAVAGDLQHRRSDSAGRAADQQRLSGLHTGLADDAQRGLHHGGVPGRLRAGQALGDTGPGRQHGELGIGA